MFTEIDSGTYLKALAVSEHAVGAHHGLAEALVGQVGVVLRVGVVQVEDRLALAVHLQRQGTEH